MGGSLSAENYGTSGVRLFEVIAVVSRFVNLRAKGFTAVRRAQIWPPAVVIVPARRRARADAITIGAHSPRPVTEPSNRPPTASDSQ